MSGRRAALAAFAAIGLGSAAGRLLALQRRSGAASTVRLVGNSFPALQHLALAAQAQNGPDLDVSFKLTAEIQNEAELAFASAGPSVFDAALVSMDVFSNLVGRGQLRPMTDLVERHGAKFQLEDRMQVRIDGDVMAIAYLQNTQNLYYRGDLFERHGIAVPRSYGEMSEAARVLRSREPAIQYPIAQCYGKGFDIAQEFTNVFASLGGRFFVEGSAEPAFNDDRGIEAIALMRSLMDHMTPNALASNSDDVMNQLQQGRAAMGVLWASRAARMDDPEASKVVGRMQFAAAPAAHRGGPSAAHLWWDGVVMPRNAGPAREAAFLVVMRMLSEDTIRSGNDLAIWTRSAYRPGRFGQGVELALRAGAVEMPGEPFFDLAHAELGKVLPDALSGSRTPRDVLDAAAAAYRGVARDKGFLRSGLS